MISSLSSLTMSNNGKDTTEDAMCRIKAMVAQEKSIRCYNYFKQTAVQEKEEVDEFARKSMVVWSRQVGAALQLRPETVWVSTSLFDRYLSSGKGRSAEALGNRYQFQLAAITSFYLAVKIHEDKVEMSAETLAILCKNYYAVPDILSTEEDILFALDWRVATPTPMAFVRCLAELLPPTVTPSMLKDLIKGTKQLVNETATDLYFAFCPPSVVGASCLVSALTTNDVLSPIDRHYFWLKLAKTIDIIDVMDTKSRLTEGQPIWGLSKSFTSSPNGTTRNKSRRASLSSSLPLTSTERQALRNRSGRSSQRRRATVDNVVDFDPTPVQQKSTRSSIITSTTNKSVSSVVLQKKTKLSSSVTSVKSKGAMVSSPGESSPVCTLVCATGANKHIDQYIDSTSPVCSSGRAQQVRRIDQFIDLWIYG